MKRSRNNRYASEAPERSKPIEGSDAVASDSLGLDDDDAGFGGWLRSAKGVETMKLFVIGNSIVAFTTVALPGMQAAYGIIRDWLYGDSLE